MRTPALVDLVALAGALLLIYAAFTVSAGIFALILGALLVTVYFILETR